ncbi:MAG: 16S rRNA (uracil(1498)-N(3))-methyltransferase [Burkholderiaceae bacterium]
MTLPRFHVDIPLVVGAPTTLSRAATRHALRALRLRQGDMLTLFNGHGGEYAAQLVHAREPQAEVQVVRFDPREAELPWPVTVAQGLSSGDRMDWTVEKGVELGAAAIAPLAMARSVVRLYGERAISRRAHWQALAAAASEQCGRNRIAQIEPVAPLGDWLSVLPDATLRLVLTAGGAPLGTISRPPTGRRVVLLAGPEGGFTDDELRAVDHAGFRATTLGPRILRTETAAAAAIAMLTALWDSE